MPVPLCLAYRIYLYMPEAVFPCQAFYENANTFTVTTLKVAVIQT
jgi:hypothetical protein